MPPAEPGYEPANWKIVVDNYLEGYHVPIAHPGLMRLLDYKRYDVEIHESLGLPFNVPLRDGPRELHRRDLSAPTSRHGQAGQGGGRGRHASSFMFYPNATINLYPDQIGI